jgi:hypothetical protein
MDIGTQGSGGDAVTDPLTFATGGANGVATLKSVPAYLSLASNQQNHVWYGWGYLEVDDPSLAPGTSVANIESGLSAHYGQRSGDMLNITVGSGFPAGGLRIGVIACDAHSGDGAGTITLAQTAGTGPFDSATVNTPGTGGWFSFFFFDVSGVQQGDVLTLSVSKGSWGNAHAIYEGVSLDVVPEPSTFLAGRVGPCRAGTGRLAAEKEQDLNKKQSEAD